MKIRIGALIIGFFIAYQMKAQITIVPGGNVGVGELLPLTKLHVASSNASKVFIEGTGGFTSIATQRTDGKWIALGAESTHTDLIVDGSSSFQVSHVESSLGPNFTSVPMSILNKRFVINVNGDVGIGDFAPLAKLHISDRDECELRIHQTGNSVVFRNSFSTITDKFSELEFRKQSAGLRHAFLDFDGQTQTSQHGVKVRFFRKSSNVNDAEIYIYKGNGGNAVNHKFSGISDTYLNLLLGNVGIGTTSPTEKLHVAGNIYATGTIVPSDRRLKQNIKSFELGLKEVLLLNPINFEYNGKASTTKGDQHIGLFAQELQNIAPDLVKEFIYVNSSWDEEGDRHILDEESYLKIKDSEIKYLLINAIKEQHELIVDGNEMIDKLSKEVKSLRSELSEMKQDILKKEPAEFSSESHLVALIGSSEVFLGQNVPNPFKTETSIDYAISIDFREAYIQIYNMSGELIHTEQIGARGSGVVHVKTTNMASGIYAYTIVLDGKQYASRTMILAK